MGWGDPIAAHFDPNNRVADRARGGRSSRPFLVEGLWDKVLAERIAGNFVRMQLGHNDGGGLEGVYPTGGRASIKGNGDETKEKEAGHVAGLLVF